MWKLSVIIIRGVRSAVQRSAKKFWAIFITTLCGAVLAKTITVLHLIFAITYAVRCNLKFNQNHNSAAPYFCDHICSAVYKMRFEWFEVGIYFQILGFFTQPKAYFSLCFGLNFKLLS